MSTRGHQNCTNTAGVLGPVSLAFGQEGLIFLPLPSALKYHTNSAVRSARAPKTLTNTELSGRSVIWVDVVSEENMMSMMTSPDLLAESHCDNDYYCFTGMCRCNLNKMNVLMSTTRPAQLTVCKAALMVFPTLEAAAGSHSVHVCLKTVVQ